jgi:hypothetical protein
LLQFLPADRTRARRFANTYTRLFVRYPGLEDSKLGTEGMSGGEKLMMGYNIANASAGYCNVGFRRNRSDLQRAGHNLHYSNRLGGDGFSRCEHCLVGEKRGRPTATPRRQGVQVDSNTAGESGIRTGGKVTVAKIISQLRWSKLNIFLPGNAA